MCAGHAGCLRTGPRCQRCRVRHCLGRHASQLATGGSRATIDGCCAGGRRGTVIGTVGWNVQTKANWVHARTHNLPTGIKIALTLRSAPCPHHGPTRYTSQRPHPPNCWIHRTCTTLHSTAIPRHGVHDKGACPPISTDRRGWTQGRRTSCTMHTNPEGLQARWGPPTSMGSVLSQKSSLNCAEVLGLKATAG